MNWFHKTTLALASAAALGLGTHAQADTTVGGIINTDTHWMTGNGPFIVDQSILVTNNATLTIDPGVEVRIKPDRGILVNSGQLIARGTEMDKITFTADVPDLSIITEDQRWGFIGFSDGAVDATFDAGGNYLNGSIIEHAIVEGAGGVSGGAINTMLASPFISHSLIQKNSRQGINIDGSVGMRIIGNTIAENDRGIVLDRGDSGGFPTNILILNNTVQANRDGILVDQTVDVELAQNNVTGNLSNGIMIDSTSGALVTENTVSGNRVGMEIGNSLDVALTRNTVTGNTSGSPDAVAGIQIAPASSGNSVTLNGDIIANNDGTGLGVFAIESVESLILSLDPDHPTQIFGNTGFQLRNGSSFTGASLSDSGNVDARNVFWGTTDIGNIEDGIFDFFDDISRGIVFFDPVAVPEPAAAALLGVGALLCLTRRRNTRA